MKITLKEEVWQDKNGKAVPFGDESGVSVLYGAGVTIDDEAAKKHGLTAGTLEKEVPTPSKMRTAPEETKALRNAPETK